MYVFHKLEFELLPKCDNCTNFIIRKDHHLQIYFTRYLEPLTFQFLSFSSARPFLQQTIHVILQQSFTRQHPIDINVVILGGVLSGLSHTSTVPWRHRASWNHLLMIIYEHEGGHCAQYRYSHLHTGDELFFNCRWRQTSNFI